METLADDLKLKVSRGYSDHEHLDRAGFVHMNGRVYDPRTGRFLSPDPVVEDPAFSQSWHSYGYVANSPLSLADPIGLFAQCPIPTLGFSCDPAASPGGFGGAIDTIFSFIHRYWFDFYVYKAPSFGFAIGDEGLDLQFDVVDLIGVAVSVVTEIVRREVRFRDNDVLDEPMETSSTSTADSPQMTKSLLVADRPEDQQTSGSDDTHEPVLVGPGKWVIQEVDLDGWYNTGQMLMRFTRTRVEGRFPGSYPKDYEGTRRVVTQRWEPLEPIEVENLEAQGLVSVERRYGETKRTEQVFLKGSDNWDISGKSYHWQPAVAGKEFEFE